MMLVPNTAGATLVLTPDGALSLGVTDVVAIELEFHDLINDERTAGGLAPLSSFDDLIDGARSHASEMAEAGYLYHNPDLTSITAFENWFQLGENVGYGSNVDVLHNAFMDSSPHAANVLNDTYNYLGVGAKLDDNGTIWVSMVFMYGPEGLSSAPAQAPETSTSPFADVDGTTHEAAIAAITEARITSGCDNSGELYCPDALVSRAQMATFLTRALELPEASEDYFTDDDGSLHEDSINRLAEAGVTVGCGKASFCPEESMTREQMAAFVVRAFTLPDTDTDFFVDDPLSLHQASINALAASGITAGCAADNYCPLDNVTRGQMATFLARALDLI